MRQIVRTVVVAGITSVLLSIPWTGPLVGSRLASAATPTCYSSWLTAKLGRSSGAAGTSYITLEIVNHSASSCSLRGTPVALPGNVSSGAHWVSVGPQAVKVTYAGRGGLVVIRTGRVASVEFGVATAGNYSKNKCGPKAITGVEIIFSAKSPVYLDYPLPRQAVCTKLASTSITGIALGTHFP
jgi:hypothetical protein